jgi:hypothetical protein
MRRILSVGKNARHILMIWRQCGVTFPFFLALKILAVSTKCNHADEFESETYRGAGHMNPQEHEMTDRETVRFVDLITVKATQLHSLLATIAAAVESRSLPAEHVSNVLWLAGDLAEEISKVASQMPT